MAEQNFRFEEMYYDGDREYQVMCTYFVSQDAALDYMQLKIKEFIVRDMYYECFVTYLCGDCPQIAQYVQKEFLK